MFLYACLPLISDSGSFINLAISPAFQKPFFYFQATIFATHITLFSEKDAGEQKLQSFLICGQILRGNEKLAGGLITRHDPNVSFSDSL